MLSLDRLMKVLASGAVCLACAACSSQSAPGADAPVERSLQEVHSLYRVATETPRRSVRKPLRDRRDRAMDLLSARAGALAEQASAWEVGDRLTGIDPQERERTREAIGSMRTSLEQLQAAAASRDMKALRSAYASTTRDYRQLQCCFDAAP